MSLALLQQERIDIQGPAHRVKDRQKTNIHDWIPGEFLLAVALSSFVRACYK